MNERIVHINMVGPESVVVSKEERYELIAQVARALEERRQANCADLDYDCSWESGESVFDFSKVEFEIN